MAKEECVICGKGHPRCNAHNTRGEPCMRWPRDCEPVCQKHGGNNPRVRAAGERKRAAKAAAKDAQAALGFTLDGTVEDVVAAMEGLAAMRLAMVDSLAQRVNALGTIRYSSDYGVEQVRAEVQMLDKAIDSAAKLLELVAKHRPDGEAAAAVNLLTSLSEQIKATREVVTG